MDLEENCSKNKTELKDTDAFPVELQKSLEKIIKNEGYISHNIHKRIVSTEGGNYLAVLYEVDIKGKTLKGEKETNIFIKHIFPADHFKLFSVTDAYLNESFMYNELFRIYNDLQDEADVPANDRLNIVKSYRESNSEAIILENLRKKGFDTMYRMDAVTLQFAELSIQQLAKFHGLSFVLQNRRPDYFDKKLRSLKQPFASSDELESLFENQGKIVCAALKESCKEKVEKYLSLQRHKFLEYLKEDNLPGSCLLHGDFKPGNILKKEKEGDITDVILIDYQLCYYGCPVNDLMTFIFFSTDQEFRRQHLTNLKDLYYNTLDKFLQYFDMDINVIYPRKEFEKQFKERLEFGFLIAIIGLPIIFVVEDDIPDMSTVELCKFSFHVDNKYEKRIQGVVDDFIEWGYL